MDMDKENQILNELKNINKSIQELNNKIDNIDSDGKPPLIIWGLIKSLLIGVFILGPAIAIAMTIFQLIGSFFFN